MTKSWVMNHQSNREGMIENWRKFEDIIKWWWPKRKKRTAKAAKKTWKIMEENFKIIYNDYDQTVPKATEKWMKVEENLKMLWNDDDQNVRNEPSKQQRNSERELKKISRYYKTMITKRWVKNHPNNRETVNANWKKNWRCYQMMMIKRWVTNHQSTR